MLAAWAPSAPYHQGPPRDRRMLPSTPLCPPHDFTAPVASVIHMCPDTGLPIVLAALTQPASNPGPTMLLTATAQWPHEVD